MQEELSKREKLANYTAGALLLPKEIFYDDLNAYGYFKTRSRWKRVRVVKKLARKYGVDITLVIKRIKEIQMLYNICG